MAEVEEAYQTLEKNHGNSWTSEQLRECANKYQTKEQASLDVPPSGHFFVRKMIKCHLRLRMRDALTIVNFLNLSIALKLSILPRVGGITNSVHRATREVAPADGERRNNQGGLSTGQSVCFSSSIVVKKVY